jgi:hypothetical protein
MVEERRKDYPDILDTLDIIRKEMAEVKLNAIKIATLVEERNLSALQWRVDVCKKFEKIFNWLEILPCKERKLNTKLVWLAIGVLGTLLFIHLGWK